MMDMSINVAGVPVRVSYGSVTDSPDAISVAFTQMPNNQTKFNILSNPKNIPPDMVRVLVGCVHEQLMRMAQDVPSPLYIVLEN